MGRELSRPAPGVNLFTNYFKYVAQSVFVKQKLACVQTGFQIFELMLSVAGSGESPSKSSDAA